MADIPDYTGVLQQTLANNAQIMRDNFSPAADLTRAQTADQNIKNQVASLQLEYMKQLPTALANLSGQSPSNGNDALSGDSDSGHDVSGTAMQTLQARYAPLPMTTLSPSEMQAATLANLSGQPQLADLIKTQHTQKIDAANQQRAALARRQYNDFYGIATAPEGQALNVLSLTDPDAAKRLGDAGASDDDVRAWASKLAGQLHVAARLPVEYDKGGIAVDKDTQQEIPGFDHSIGLTADQRAQILKDSNAQVKVDLPDGSTKTMFQWQADNLLQGTRYQSGNDRLSAFVDHANDLRNGRFGAPPAASSPTPVGRLFAGQGGPSAAPQSGSPPAPAAPTAPRPQPTPAQTPQQQNSNAWRQPRNATEDWRALNANPQVWRDPDFQLRAPSGAPGQSATPGALQEQKNIADSKSDLLKQQGDNAKAAGQALRYYSLAADVLNSGGVTTGWGQHHIAQFSSALQQIGIPTSWLGDPSKSAELVKALTNAGLQDLKSTYGTKVTQNEVFLNLEHANPNADMPLPALRQLINDQTQNLIYTVHSAQRVGKYLAAGNDPRSFDNWNQKYFPREIEAGPQQSGGGQSSAPAPAPRRLGTSAQPDSSGFVVGRTYRDKATGRTAVYQGNGAWQ